MEDDLRKRIEDGQKGVFQGLENGFKDLNKYIFGVQQKCYTLIGGMSGTFKTTLLDYIILNAIQDAKAKNIPIDVFYYSFEIDKLTKQCNWLAQLAYNNYGRIITPEKIKGLGNNRLDPEEKQIIDSLIPEMNQIFNEINFTFDAVNPTGIYNEIFAHCSKNGTFKYATYKDENGQVKQKIDSYTPNEFRYTIVAVDHLYLLKKERQFDTKKNMDKMSEYFVNLRNIFNISPFVVQQFNQGLNAVDRQKYKGVDLSPSQNDFKDTTNPYQDADVVLGIMNPFKLDIEKYLGYDIKQFRDAMIALKIIKNRLSGDNKTKALLCHPESGRFQELPLASKINYEAYKKR